MRPEDLGREGILAGREVQGRLRETPGALSIENSVTQNSPTHALDSTPGTGRRFAGEQGSFAMSLMDKRNLEGVNRFTTQLESPAAWKIGTPYDKGGTMV